MDESHSNTNCNVLITLIINDYKIQPISQLCLRDSLFDWTWPLLHGGALTVFLFDLFVHLRHVIRKLRLHKRSAVTDPCFSFLFE